MHFIEEKICEKLTNSAHTETDIMKIKFGIHIMLQEIIKVIIIYMTAIVLDVLLEVLIVHLTFFIIRQVSLGYHFSSKLICIIWSVMLFPVLCKIILIYEIRFNWVIFITCVVLIGIIGPVGTDKMQIVSKRHKTYLLKSLLIRLLIICCLFFILSSYLQNLVTLGLIIQLVMVISQLIINKKGRECTCN